MNNLALFIQKKLEIFLDFYRHQVKGKKKGKKKLKSFMYKIVKGISVNLKTEISSNQVN